MKIIFVVFVLGLLGLYFVNMALLKFPFLDLEWSIHAAIRFLLGFFVCGMAYFYAKALSIKQVLLLIAVIVAMDYVYDFYVQNYRMRFEVVLHGIYMLIWGTIMGYLTAKRLL